MKTIKTLFALAFFFLFTSFSYAQCTLACFSELSVSLDATGSATLTPSEILAFSSPGCGPLSVIPNTFSCADVGTSQTVLVVDGTSGNSCFSEIFIDDKFAPTIACNANVSAVLPMDGTLELTSGILLAGASDNCPLTYTIVPSVLTCSDFGSTTNVIVTATDPGGNTSSCFSQVDLQILPSALSCLAQLNVSLPSSGVATITPDDILVGPTPPACALVVTVPTVTCADVGVPVNVSVLDTLSGNSCFSTLIVEDKIAPLIACNALTNVQLGSGGLLILNGADLLALADDNCPLNYTITPSQVDCSDKGNTISYNLIASDPGGNTASCFGDVFVEDPKPSSCNLTIPTVVPCGATGLPFGVNVTGGYGPFTYDWSIKGNPNGWSITGGQGTPNITMNVGIKKIQLSVKITDVCGKSIKCQEKITCSSGSPFVQNKSEEAQFSLDFENEQLTIYPNPAEDHISWKIKGADLFNVESTYQIINSNGQTVHDGKTIERFTNIDNLSPGIYFFRVIHNNEITIKRFVKVD